jgi:4-hydroxy-3-methylbut-2-enyl diphosphate reductase
MKVLKAAAMGMCFGVRAALDGARSVMDPTRVTLYGELVHNESLQAELRAQGFASLPEGGRPVPSTPVVMVTAHGVSDRERQRLQAAGKEVLDTTCPLVRLAHQVALEAQEAADLVVVVGRPGHVEVQGLVGDLERFRVVWDAADVSEWGAPRIAVMAQTTTPPWHAEALVAEIRRRNPSSAVRFLDTICRPTRDRQQAVQDLLERVQALVVVGGRASNNTRQLARLSEARGLPTLLVQGPADLDRAWLARFEVVGLTAGTSTPDQVVEAVHRALLEVGAPTPRNSSVRSLLAGARRSARMRPAWAPA